MTGYAGSSSRAPRQARGIDPPSTGTDVTTRTAVARRGPEGGARGHVRRRARAAVAGITTYGFFIACARGLSEKDYAAVIGGLWPLVFVVAPGCFLPLEQEVGRALAHRRAQGIGGGPLVRRAAIAAAWGTAGARAPRARLQRRAHRAPVQGRRRPRPLLRDRAGHLRRAAPHAGHALGQRPLRSVRHHPRRRGRDPPPARAHPLVRGRRQPGGVRPVPRHPARARERCSSLRGQRDSSSRARGAVVGAVDEPRVPAHRVAPRPGARATRRSSIATVLATSDDHGAVAAFVSGFFLARIPILLFQAVQAALLPKLARLAGAGEHEDFRIGLRKLILVVVGIGLLGVVGGSRSVPGPARSSSTSRSAAATSPCSRRGAACSSSPSRSPRH